MQKKKKQNKRKGNILTKANKHCMIE